MIAEKYSREFIQNAFIRISRDSGFTLEPDRVLFLLLNCWVFPNGKYTWHLVI